MQQFIKMRKQVSMTESTRLVLNKSIDLLHKLSNGKLAKEEVKKEISVLLSTYFVTVYPQSERGIDAEKKLKLEHLLDQAYSIADQVESGKAPLYEAIMLMNKVVVNLKPNEIEDDTRHVAGPKNRNRKEEEEEEEEAPEGEAPEAQEEEEEEEEEEEAVYRKPTEREVVRFRPVNAEIDEAFEDEIVEERVQKSVKMVDSFRPRKAKTITPTDGEVTDLIGNVLKQQKELESSISYLNESLNRIGFELKKI